MDKILTYEEYKDINDFYRALFIKMSENIIYNSDTEYLFDIPESLEFIKKSEIYKHVFRLSEIIIENYNIEVSNNIIELATSVAIGNIYYVDDKVDNVEELKDKLQYLLEELQLSGIGNGIVKNISNILTSSIILYNYITQNEVESFVELYESDNTIMIRIIDSVVKTLRAGTTKTIIEDIPNRLATISDDLITTDIRQTIDGIIGDNSNDNIINERK